MKRREFFTKTGIISATLAVIPSAAYDVIYGDKIHFTDFKKPSPPKECYLMVIRGDDNVNLFMNINAVQKNGTKFIKTDDFAANIAHGWVNGVVEYGKGFNSVLVGNNMFIVDDFMAKMLKQNYDESYLHITRKTTVFVNKC